MPTYQYRCTDCGRDLEVVQKFSDASLTVCPTCSGTLRKVFNAVGVVFKGSGFYRNDSRTAPAEASSESAGADKKPVDAKTGSGDAGGSSGSGDSKPAKTEASKPDAKASTPTPSTGTKAAAG